MVFKTQIMVDLICYKFDFLLGHNLFLVRFLSFWIKIRPKKGSRFE